MVAAWFYMPQLIILMLISLVGFYGNSSIVYASIRCPNVRNPCNILISIVAIGDIIHQVHPFIFATLASMGRITIPISECFWIQLIPATVMNHSVFMLLTLSFDRLLSVAFPMSYGRWMSTTAYILLQLIAPTLYSVGIALVSYKYISDDVETMCNVIGFFAGPSREMMFICTLGISALCMLIYAVIFAIVRKQINTIGIALVNMKSIFIIMFVTVASWFLGVFALPIITLFNVTPAEFAALATYGGILVNVAIASNYFIYKRFSSEYQRAFKEMWNRSAVFTVASTVTQTNQPTVH